MHNSTHKPPGASPSQQSYASLTPSELADLRELLLQQRERLNAVIRHRAIAAQMLAHSPPEVQTKRPPDEEDLRSCQHPARDIAELQALDLALQKIDQPSTELQFLFGHCEQCGDVIGYERLLMHPAARHCLKCQRSAEKH